jgi:peptide/nickel transport system substrate-binding protein
MAATTIWRPIRVLTGVLAMSLLASGCSSETSAPPATTADEPVTAGGTLILGASQQPNCADWYAPCGGSSWGLDMMGRQTMPRAFDVVDYEYRPSPLLAGEPTLEIGPPQKVTYRINPAAIWSDGQPITAKDFKYSAEQARLTGTLNSPPTAIDDTDPTTVVVTWSDGAAGWRDQFSRILPSHLLEGKDRTAEMRDGYRWSGGPWIIDHWTKGEEIKLVPNPRYWGKKPNLDAIVFKIIPDAAAYLAAYKTGQVDMIFLQGAQPEVLELKPLPDTGFEVQLGLTYEFLTFNTAKPPLDSRAVRQALAYASDRDVIVSQLSGPLMPGIKPAQAFMSPANKQFYSEPFARYRRDLARVSQLMTGDGWTKGTDGIWVKAGARATVELNTMTGNRRRELTQEILQSQWKEAGFETTVNNTASATLLGEWRPRGTFQASITGNAPTSTDPNACTQFCSTGIPTEANRYQGGNFARITSPALDAAWGAVAREVDAAKRVPLVRQAQELLAEEVPVLPISPVLDIVVFNSAKVGGPVSADPGGIFSRINEWYCRSSSCRR